MNYVLPEEREIGELNKLTSARLMTHRPLFWFFVVDVLLFLWLSMEKRRNVMRKKKRNVKLTSNVFIFISVVVLLLLNEIRWFRQDAIKKFLNGINVGGWMCVCDVCAWKISFIHEIIKLEWYKIQYYVNQNNFLLYILNYLFIFEIKVKFIIH